MILLGAYFDVFFSGGEMCLGITFDLVSIALSPGINTATLSKSHHLPIGHFSEAMRSFACVEHPHLRQRPVPAMPAASHKSQALQVSMRAASVSGSVAVKPEPAHLTSDEPRLAACCGRLGGVGGYALIRAACSGVFSPRDMQ
jgi:hypothetical protein